MFIEIRDRYIIVAMTNYSADYKRKSGENDFENFNKY